MSEALDNLAAAVRHVGNAVGGVADRLKNHPAANDDPTLKDMATQLETAATTLDGLANDPASADPQPVQSPGTTVAEEPAPVVAEDTTDPLDLTQQVDGAVQADPAAVTDPPADATNDPTQPEATPTPPAAGDNPPAGA